MFFETLGRYSVIFQAVLGGLTADHYCAYFSAFINTYDIEFTDEANFSGLVIDFSDAQREGFVRACKRSRGDQRRWTVHQRMSIALSTIGPAPRRKPCDH